MGQASGQRVHHLREAHAPGDHAHGPGRVRLGPARGVPMKWKPKETVERPFHSFLCIGATAPSGYYARMVDNTGLHAVKSFKVNGHAYAIDPEEARHLKGWRGKAKDGFWAEFTDIIPSRIGILFYVEPTDPLHGVEIPVPPVDRVNEIDLERVDSPAVYNAILNSPLHRRY